MIIRPILSAFAPVLELPRRLSLPKLALVASLGLTGCPTTSSSGYETVPSGSGAYMDDGHYMQNNTGGPLYREDMQLIHDAVPNERGC